MAFAIDNQYIQLCSSFKQKFEYMEFYMNYKYHDYESMCVYIFITLPQMKSDLELSSLHSIHNGMNLESIQHFTLYFKGRQYFIMFAETTSSNLSSRN